MSQPPRLREQIPLYDCTKGQINYRDKAHIAPIRIAALREHLQHAGETHGPAIFAEVATRAKLPLLALDLFLRGQNFRLPCEDSTRCADALAEILAEHERTTP
jgi:hypothetical protein